jgi:hypothetical protein
MMAPGTMDPHLTTLLCEERGEAETQIVPLLRAVHARRNLAVCTVGESLGP